MRIESLTFFRFIAASIVVIFHYGRGTSLAAIAPGFLTAGPEMVTFFFVLSGFVLMIAYWDHGLVTNKYWRTRLARIAPTYYLAFAAVLFLESADFERPAILVGSLFLQSWFPPYPLSVNLPAWAVSVEVFLYLSFPFLFWVLKSRSPKPLSLMGLAFSFWLFSQLILMNLFNSSFYHPFPSASHDLIFYFPPSHLSSFLLGVAGGYHYLKTSNKKNIDNWLLTLGFIAICVAIFFIISHEAFLAGLIGWHIPFAAGFFAPLFMLFILFTSCARNTHLLQWLGNRYFALLGNASYAIYIFQLPFKQFMDVYIFPSLELSNAELSFYIYFIALVLFSVLAYLLFEKPIFSFLSRKGGYGILPVSK